MPGRFLETNFPATKVFVGQDSAENFPATAAFARRGSLVLRGSSESAEGGAEDVLFPKMNAVLQRSRAPSPFSTWVFERERERLGGRGSNSRADDGECPNAQGRNDGASDSARTGTRLETRAYTGTKRKGRTRAPQEKIS